MEACIFCKIIQREEPSYILDENEDVLVFLSLENHPLVVPKKHIPDIYALVSAEDLRASMEKIKEALQ